MFSSDIKVIVVLCACGFAVCAVDFQKLEHICGVEASPNPLHHNPWTVLLEYYRRGQRYETRCGATLITSRHVVTAAHCVRRGLTKHFKLVARLGEFDLSSETDCIDGVCAHPPIKIKAASVSLHPRYDGSEHDIAIITLAHEVPFTDTIRPACLPSGVIEDETRFNAAGWGEDALTGVFRDIKKNLYLPFWSRDRCQNAYTNTVLPKHIICAGGERGIDTCRGDSGGPLMWGKDRAQLWGVTSTGDTVCGSTGYPGIYTSVVDHLTWISKIISTH